MDVIVEGLKIVGNQAKDNPKVKRAIIAPIEEKVKPVKDKFKGKWDHLSKFQKATAISVGVGALGGTLANPEGRKLLEGINLAAPLNLIPGMPEAGFKYTLPSGESPEKRSLKFNIDVGFNAGDLFNRLTETHGLPHMPLRVNMQWGYDPTDGQLSILSGNASLGIMRGLTLSAGKYKDVLRPKPMMGPEGETTRSVRSIPDFDKPQPIPDERIMITLDLLQLL
jgi:hypothetical protein